MAMASAAPCDLTDMDASDVVVTCAELHRMKGVWGGVCWGFRGLWEGKYVFSGVLCIFMDFRVCSSNLQFFEVVADGYEERPRVFWGRIKELPCSILRVGIRNGWLNIYAHKD